MCACRHIGLLKVKGRKMNLQKIPLKTVRQFYIQDVVLADFEDQFTPETPEVVKMVEDLCFAKVQLLNFFDFIFFTFFMPASIDLLLSPPLDVCR